MEQMTIHSGAHFERVFLNEPGIELHLIQEAGSQVKIHLIHIPDAAYQGIEPVVNRITIEQQGEGCESEIYALAWLQDQSQVTIETHVLHAVGGGRSNQLIKFVVDDESKGRFIGDLKIAQDAQQTEAHQTNRNLLLSETAEIRTQPQLEIYADDVKATHGASTGQLDESALFYMQQRGIDKQKARQLLVGAFMKDVIETISDEGMREKLLHAVDSEIE